MNVVYLIGRSGADAELKYTQQGTAILNFSIATSEKQGETWVSTWHKIVCFAKKAEDLAPLIKKGSEVFVCGKIQNREWTNKEGQKVKSSDIMANWVRVCDKSAPPPRDAYADDRNYGPPPSGQRPPQQQQQHQYPPSSPMMSGGMDESDVPF